MKWKMKVSFITVCTYVFSKCAGGEFTCVTIPESVGKRFAFQFFFLKIMITIYKNKY